ncbi:hypothetical protein [Variovorax boronicumulans]|uniref:hypothetical protein n=1 Tax=Variovorax boronicumulans TaxID=436515 RepID=UPI003390B85E
MTQRHFFALPGDLLLVFDAVESKAAVSYTLAGIFDTPDVTSVHAGRALPSLRVPAAASSIDCATYLVMPADVAVQVRPIPTSLGATRFAIDQLLNPASVTLSHGGFDVNMTLISGRVATASDALQARRLQSAFANAIGRLFERVNAYWVGPMAMEHFQRGGRLTHNASSPSEYDLAQARAQP